MRTYFSNSGNRSSELRCVLRKTLAMLAEPIAGRTDLRAGNDGQNARRACGVTRPIAMNTQKEILQAIQDSSEPVKLLGRR
jgi:hypothetical protein